MRKALLLLALFSLFGAGCLDLGIVEIAPKPGEAETKQAIETGNPNLCLELPESAEWVSPWDGDVSFLEPKQKCLESYVYAKKKVENCELLERPSDKVDCLDYMAMVNSDPEICETRKSTPNAWVLYPKCIAIANLDENKCFDILTNQLEGLSDPHLLSIRASELGDCMVEIAIEKRDSRICELIDGPKFGYLTESPASPTQTWEDRRSTCLTRVAACNDDSSQTFCAGSVRIKQPLN